MIRFAIAAVVLAGCVKQAQQIVAPESEAAGTMTCRELVEKCDAECSDPLCLHRCSPQGTADAREQHDTLLACGERNSCTDQDCMQASCPGEIQTCFGAEPPAAPPPAEPPGAAPPAAPEPDAPGQVK